MPDATPVHPSSEAAAGAARLSVLVLTAQFPYPPRSGFAVRVYHVLCALAARHDVTVLSYVDGAQRAGVDPLRDVCAVEAVDWQPAPLARKRLAQLAGLASRRPYASRSLVTPAMQEAIDALAARTRFDVVQLESSLLTAFRLPAGARVVLDEHNIESEVHARTAELERSPLRRRFGALEALRLQVFERACWRRADGVIVTSPREAPLVAAHAPATPIAVVPNGVDTDEFRPSPEPPAPDSVVFNGRLDYRPNLDAARWLVEEIWPRVLERRPGARLAIVGRGEARDVAALARPSVELTGEVPDVKPYLADAVVTVVPIRSGGGTRLKVVEALSMARPMVSTTLGCEGIAVRDGEHLLIADDAAAFAERITALLADPGWAATLGVRGRRLMETDYAWRLAEPRLAALYDRVAARSAG
jgi:sugar transferase (PEP-CTERM/EpsH1 system associated)